jgi:hypothetical protein
VAAGHLCRSKFVNDTFKATNRWIKLADHVHDTHFNLPSSDRPEGERCSRNPPYQAAM